MDIGDEDSLEYGNGECRSYPSPHPSSDWQCNHVANWSARLIPGASPMPICKDDIVGRSCTSVSMAGSFHPMIWQHGQSSQPMAFNELDMHSNNSVATESNGVVPGAEVGWVLPHSLSSFPVDTASIERATRLSSFYEGIVADAMNPFSILHDANATNPIPHENVLIMARTSMDHTNGINGRKNGREESCFDEAQGIAMLVDNSDVAELLGGSKENQPMMDIGNVPFSAEDLESKKRKRGCQGVESERTNQDSQQFDEVAKISGEMPNKPKRNPCPTTSNAMAKLVKQNSEASDPLKGEYMHFRARRGQATNSHSLAERVRREKISERMRLLQDLVPSCSKATVKAVMLDEIINYVKSLQQQVEFLSMKLATVSPSLDFNLDKLLLKDMLMVQSNPSTTMGCSADMPTAYPFRETEQTAYQLCAPIIGNSPDAARTVTSQIPTSNLSFSNLSSFSRP